LGRTVAVKLLKTEPLGDLADRERFFREARAVAQLRHAGIVTVHEIVEVNGTPAIVSEFIDGCTLKELIKSGHLSPRQIASLVLQVAEAVHHAHCSGLVHRDIKPSNILVQLDAAGSESEVAADGTRSNSGRPVEPDRPLTAFLTDFGLALREDVEITMTADGQIIGTPAYMSPEQAAGGSHCVDGRSDVYSLGVVLYELLCGSLPFRGSKITTLHRILHEEPRLPRRVDPRVPRDLETICLKAMAKDAKQRYKTAAEFASDLRRWLAGEPISARPVGAAGRALRWARRNPKAALRLVLALLLATVGVVAAIQINLRSQAERLAQTILVAKPQELSQLVANELPRFRRWANPALRRAMNDANADLGRRLRASIALAPVDPSQGSYLSERLLTCSWDEFAPIRDSLQPNASLLIDRLWRTLRDAEQEDEVRFRCGLALASFAPNAEWLEPDIELLARTLVMSNPDYQRDLRMHLSPVGKLLLRPLETVFHDEAASDTQREAAAAALADFARHDREFLARLTCGATPPQFRLLFPQWTASASDRQAAAVLFQSELRPGEPDPAPDGERIRVGRHRAGAGIALARLQSPATALDALQFDSNPEMLTQFVHGAAERGIRSRDLLGCLELATTVSQRFAILLTLADYPLDSIPPQDRESLLGKLVQWHGSDPSSAIHSATAWLLRTWRQDEQIAEMQRTAVPYDPTGVREWFVQRIDDAFVTFVVFPPGKFVMGSPSSEPHRDVDEPQHIVQITRPFAVADREVTFAQWQRFVDSTGRVDVPENREELTDRHAAIATWSDAVAFCHWLTGAAGIAKTEQCYDASSGSAQSDEPETWPFHLDRLGFRLPTEAEWEYACRAGTTTAYGFGSDAQLLRYYAAFDGTTATSLPVATLRPSMRGLFDIYGNVAEWCHDVYRSGFRFEPFEVDPVGPSGSGGRIFRGGAWNMHPRYCRSAARATPAREITIRYSGVGLRIACTLP
jgi:formylglycine-generating enzyme required for sulfatase activity